MPTPNAGRNRAAAFCFGICAGSVLVASCVTANSPANVAGTSESSPDDIVVTERSKAEPPAWLSLSADAWQDGPSGYLYLAAKRQLLDLPMGLKETQLVGGVASRRAMGDQVTRQLLAAARAKGLSMPTPGVDSSRKLQRQAEAAAATLVKISDLYFEATDDRGLPPDDPKRHTFLVAVLFILPKDQYPQVFATLSHRLQGSSDALERQLAPVAKELSEVVPKVALPGG